MKLIADSQQIGTNAICPNCRTTVKVQRGGMDGATFALSIVIVQVVAVVFSLIVAKSDSPPGDAALPVLMVCIALMAAPYVLFRQRLVNLGWNLDWAWWSFLPVVNLVLAIYLACAKPK